MIAAGGSLEHIIDNTTSYQAIKTAMTILPIKEPKRDFKPYVEWIYGPTGTARHTRHTRTTLGRVFTSKAPLTSGGRDTMLTKWSS